VIGPIVAAAVGIYFAPNGNRYFHSTVTPGQLPVVTWHLVPEATIR
jgi:hypothetical protein